MKKTTGFVHLFKAKLQRLFKDFPGPYFQNSRTFPHTNLPPTKEMFVLLINTCTCRKSFETHASTRGSMDMRESNKRALGTKNEYFHTFCKHLILCLREHLFSLAFVYFKTHNIFWSCSIKKKRTFKDQIPTSSTFKALKSDSWNSRIFRGFQDPYEPWD